MIDLVLGGPDMSGTSTQVKDLVDHLRAKDMTIKDLSGTEIDALFHAQDFLQYNQGHETLRSFVTDTGRLSDALHTFNQAVIEYLGALQVASCVDNGITAYIDPNSADVWVMEEPTRRSSGQVCRVIEQNRSKFKPNNFDEENEAFSNLFKINPMAAAYAHQAYRTDEFLRFRGPLRDAGKIVIRSRSEESACYQIFHQTELPDGISLQDYIDLPGHEIAFGNPPTHIFVACAPENWTEKEYLELKRERSGNRTLDDHEVNAGYQLLVNKRYATEWIDELYQQGCESYGSTPPEITRFNLYDKPEVIKAQMTAKLDEILKAKEA
jgi:thymidylate kinase